MSVNKYNTNADSNVSVGDGVATVGIQEGMPRRDVNNAMRSMCADISKYTKDNNYLTTGGSADVFTATTISEYVAYVEQMTFWIKFHTAPNDGASINVNNLGEKPLRVTNGGANVSLKADDVLSGAIYKIAYDGTGFVVVGARDRTINDRITDQETKNPGIHFNTVSQLLSDTTIGYSGSTFTVSVGDYVYAGGFQYKVAASGASDHHIETSNSTPVKLYVQLIAGNITQEAFGIQDTSNDQSAKMQTLLDFSVLHKRQIIFNNKHNININTTLNIASNLDIKFIGEGRIIKTAFGAAANKNSEGIDAIFALPKNTSFNHNVRILGKFKIQYDANINANRRGSNTYGVYLDNLNKSTIEVKVDYAEYATYGLSVFDCDGFIGSSRCRTASALLPVNQNGSTATGSGGSACTDLDFKITADYAVHTIIHRNVVYSSFNGYSQATRQNMAWHEADEMAAVFTLDGCVSTSYDFGIESTQGSILSNQDRQIVVDLSLYVAVSSSDYFQHDTARIDNVAYNRQGVFSVWGANSIVNIKNSLFSGTNVTTSTSNSYLFRKTSSAKILFLGSKVTSGTNYTFTSTAIGMEAYASSETSIEIQGASTIRALGNNMEIRSTSAAIQADNTFRLTVTSPRKIVMAMPSLTRSVHDTKHAIAVVSRSATEWVFICGLGAGYSANIDYISTNE